VPPGNLGVRIERDADQLDGPSARPLVGAPPLTAVAQGAYTEGVPLMVRRSGPYEEMPR